MQKRYPFKFLDAYTRDDSVFYFGRDQEITQMYEMVFQTDLLLVYGASGTGKTSLIQCGLASRFQTHEWLSLFVRRGNNINASLDKVLLDYGGTILDQSNDLDWLDSDWTEEESPSNKNTSELAKRFTAIYLKHFKPIYLIFDQFEELYILGNKQEQHVFFETVREILQLEQPIKIIISIREEYLGFLYEFERKVPELLRKKLRVEPMNYDRVKSVIHGVARNRESIVSLKMGEEDEIASQVFAKIKGEEKRISIELPYLQVFLDKLYLATTGDETRTAEAVISLDTLGTIGDIGDVLRNLLDDQVQQTGQKLNLKPDLIWKVLSPFVTIDGTKEPLSVEMLGTRLQNVQSDVLNQILQAFVNRRILRYTENEDLYEVAHDSLARQIHARRSDEEIALLEVQRLIKSQCSIKDEAREMFTTKQLAFIEPFIEKLNLSTEEKKLIDESKAYSELQHQLELQRFKEKKRKQKQLIFIIICAAFISLIFGIFGFMNMRKAQQNEEALRYEQFDKNMEKAHQSQQTADYQSAIEYYNLALEFIDNDAVFDSIKQCQKLIGYRKSFESFLHSGDSLFNNKEYFQALKEFIKAQETGYLDVSGMFDSKKQRAINELQKDIRDYQNLSLTYFAKTTQDQIDSINNIKISKK